MTSGQVIALLAEKSRPDLSRLAGFKVDLFELKGQFIFLRADGSMSVVLCTPLFGGIQHFVVIDPSIATSVKHLEDNYLTAIKGGIGRLSAEAELMALVNYRWPAA